MRYRTGKNCFQELFGSVIPIKSVMDKLAGNFFSNSFFFAIASCITKRFALHLLRALPRTIRGQNYSGKNSEIGIIQVKQKIQSVKKNYRYRKNCSRELISLQKRNTVPD